MHHNIGFVTAKENYTGKETRLEDIINVEVFGSKSSKRGVRYYVSRAYWENGERSKRAVDRIVPCQERIRCLGRESQTSNEKTPASL